MHGAYKDDKKLCKWLRNNSSGNYRLAAYAAERIETLSLHLENVQLVCDGLEAKLDRVMLEYCPDEMGEEQIKRWEESQKPSDT